MTHPPELRADVVRVRETDFLAIDELAERYGLSRNTVYHWTRHTPPLPTAHAPRPGPEARARAAASNRRVWAERRQAAYDVGLAEFGNLVLEPTFRDFICMYIGEGFKRARGTVSICNSDPSVLVLGKRWIERFARNPLFFGLQYHADQDPAELADFWGLVLAVEPTRISLQRKSNSNQLAGRKWRSEYGVLTVGSNDTYFRARLQAWMDGVRQDWH